MRHIANILATLAAVLLLAACASAPQRSDQIEQARAAIQRLAQDPLAQQAAAQDLQSAQGRLQEAESALQQRRPPSVVDHLAYLAQRHAEAGEARVEQARAQSAVAQAQDERTRILLAQRSREAANAQNQAQAAESQAEAAKSQLAQAQQQLADLKAKQTDRGTVVTLGDVLFDTGQATLKPGADLSLDRLAAYLKTHPQTRILIEGHTDSVGSDAYNDALSLRRADAVANALISRGVSPDAVHAAGRGKAYPVATNETAAGRQQNRRVEIIFSDASGRFAQGEPTGGPVQR
jgi:outer membrane protein OmpA-like peptidoglycan-associated protein